MDTAELDRLSFLTIQSAIEIHKKLGPGLLENVYRPCMIYELLSYLRVMDKQLGLLINFHVERLVLGVDRIVNKFGWPESQACKSSEVATDKQSQA